MLRHEKTGKTHFIHSVVWELWVSLVDCSFSQPLAFTLFHDIRGRGTYCSIVIPALHQKFTLRSNNTNNGSNNGCSSTKDKGTVVRRNECILLISRNRTKVMVLQFRSLQDCLDFSDRFLALNDDDVHHPSDDDDDGDAEEERREVGSSSDEAYQFALAADRESVTAHLVRLVHEPSFEAFVRNVESSLQSTTDGEQILKSWVERDFGQSSPE